MIEGALHTCEALVAYLTPDFATSMWCDQEVGVALARGILIIPIRRGLDPYGFMGKYQALTGAGKGAAPLASEVARILAKHQLTAHRYEASKDAPAALAAIEALETAPSWNHARSAMWALKAVPAECLTPSMLARIEYAAASNGELKAQWNFGETTVADEAVTIVQVARANGAVV